VLLAVEAEAEATIQAQVGQVAVVTNFKIWICTY
jgi:hypothetical protein